MLTDAFQYGDFGFSLRYCFHRKLFNLKRLQTKIEVQNDIIHDYLVTDDHKLNAGTLSEMKESMEVFSTACEDVGLTISTEKIEVMSWPTPAAPYTKPSISVDDQKLAVADRFSYLHSTLSRTLTIDEKVTYRIGYACTSFDRLHTSVWDWRGIS